VVVAAAGLGALVGGAWGWHRDAEHQATAVILVNPLEGNPFSPEGQGDDLVNLETEAQLVTSDSVTGLVARRLQVGEPAEAARAGVSVSVPTNTQLLRIRAVDRSAAVAVQRAQAFAETYLDFRRSRTETLLFDRNARIDEQVKQLGGQLEEASRQLSAATPRSPRALLLQQQVTELTNQVGNLHTQLAASHGTSTDPGQLVTPAAEDAPGPLAGPVRSGAAGAVAAVLGSVLLVLAHGRARPTVRDPAELEPLGFPVLARDDQLAPVRARVLAAADRSPVAVLVATSAPTVRRSATALGIGGAFARASLETILVELVEFSPGAEPRAGLTDLLLDRVTIDEVLAPVTAHLNLLSAGTEGDRLDDLVAGVEMSVMLTELLKRADAVVVAAGPLTEARTQAVARLCDLTVLEVAEGRTTLADVERSVATLEQCGGTLAGLVYVPPAIAPRRTWRGRGA
jgi:Mrp family chromosome partitioning ATPase